MAKAVVRLDEFGEASKRDSMEKVKRTLSENHACYVLITCTSPSNDGKMDVEMAYDGDEVLAAYLVDSAQQVFEGNRAKPNRR